MYINFINLYFNVEFLLIRLNIFISYQNMLRKIKQFFVKLLSKVPISFIFVES